MSEQVWVEELRALEAAATPGPWVISDEGRQEYYADFAKLGRRSPKPWDAENIEPGCLVFGGEHSPDAALIAALRNAAPALITVWGAARRLARAHWSDPDAPKFHDDWPAALDALCEAVRAALSTPAPETQE